MLCKSILGGIMISIGAIANLTAGPPLGAFIFAIGLMAILNFDLYLFTGKAGLLATKEISIYDLFVIWCGNFCGCFISLSVAISLPQYDKIQNAALEIAEIRAANTIFENLLFGICCGLLMYIAVEGYKRTNASINFILPVAVFILSGYNHCVADMFYLSLKGNYNSLLMTTLGNVIGCNIIPIINADKY